MARGNLHWHWLSYSLDRFEQIEQSKISFKVDFCRLHKQKKFSLKKTKNPVGRNWFFQIDISEIKYRSTGGSQIMSSTLLPPSQIFWPSDIPMIQPMPMWVAWLIELLHQRKGRPSLLFCLVMQAYLIRVNRAYIIDLGLFKTLHFAYH